MRNPLHVAETHLFEHADRLILVDVNSGGFFEADDVIRDFLEVCEDRTLLEAFDALRDRYSEKDVFSVYKELTDAGIVSDRPIRPVTPLRPPTRQEIVQLTLIAASDRMDNTSAPRYMSAETARRAVDLLFAESGYLQTVVLNFAGDSLLYPQLVIATVDYARERAEDLGKRVVLRVETDPRLLNERLLQDIERRDGVVTYPSDHVETDTPFRGSGPYSLAAVEAGRAAGNGRLSVRLDSTLPGAGSAADRLNRLLTDYPELDVVELDLLGAGAHLRRVSDAELDDLAAVVRRHVLGHRSTWIGEIEDATSQVLNSRTAAYRDPDGIRSLAVAPEGDLFVSVALLDEPRYRLGSVSDGIDRNAQRNWARDTHVDSIAACRSCWVRYYCGGGSRSACFAQTGDALKPHADSCRTIRKTYEIAMGTCVDLSVAAPDRLHARYGRTEAA